MILRFPAPCPPWSINDAPSTVRAQIKRKQERRMWREAAYWAVCQQFKGPARRARGPSSVQVTIPFSSNRRRDPHNYTGTIVKPIIDGLVQAGVWPDDNPDWVTVVDPCLVVGSDVVVSIEPRRSRVVAL